MTKIILLLSALLFLANPTFSDNDRPHIAVIGSGSITLEPDTTVTMFTFISKQADAQSTQNAMAKFTKKIISVLNKNGISQRDYSIQHLGIRPEYRYDGGQRKNIGYASEGHLNLTLKLDSKPDMHSVIAIVSKAANQDKMTNEGKFGNTLNVSKTLYLSSLLDKTINKAAALALSNARSKANLILKTEGAITGKILSITEVSSPTHYPRPMMKANIQADYEALPTYAPQQTAQASLNVVFEISKQ